MSFWTSRSGSTPAFASAGLALGILACGLRTEPSVSPPFSVTVTLPSGDSLDLSGTSAGWQSTLGPAGFPGGLRLVLRSEQGSAELGPPIEMQFYWSSTPIPLPVSSYALSDTILVGVLFQVRTTLGSWEPDSGTVEILAADSVSIEGTFQAHLRPVNQVSDSLPRLAIAGAFTARRISTLTRGTQ